MKRVAWETFNNGNMRVMRVSNPCSILGHNVGLSIWDKIEILSDNERTEITKKAAAWRENAKKWGVLKK